MNRSQEVGDAWVYLVIAHEWGHAIQQRISLSLNDRQSELQADCLAGATLFGAVEDGSLQLEEGDVKEIANSLTLVADETPWTNSSDHGDPFERIGAFDTGRNGGVRACLPINQTSGR
jgi:predicted metalloprotease